jgi:hypothetical protein
MSILPASIEHLVSWGQYMHWAEIHFERFRLYPADADHVARIGVVAHWLASEYVVLEGWSEIDMTNERVSRLLSAYPEHKDLLRRCRNAVYHFQKDPLDARLSRVLKDENEELRWAVALHFELQGVLLQLSDQLRTGGPLNRQIAAALARTIGWFPRHPYAEETERIENLCLEFEELVGSDQSAHAEEARGEIAKFRAQIESLDMYPLSSALRRLQATPLNGSSSAA